MGMCHSLAFISNSNMVVRLSPNLCSNFGRLNTSFLKQDYLLNFFARQLS